MKINKFDNQGDFIKYIEQYNKKYDKIFLLTQKSITHYYSFIKKIDINLFICSENEECKSIQEYEKIIQYLSDEHCNKRSLIIGLGGGSVTDLSGFIAASYMRGIDHILIPTTLLGMVDASIGGKTALNVNNIRNLIGSFKNPEEVVLYFNFLQTLNKHDILNGYAEIIKYSLIIDCNLFDLLEKNISVFIKSINTEEIKSIIELCIKHKLSIVNQDQFDNNIRMILNFGHTLGHALESYYNYELSHGKAVLYGILLASYLSYKEHSLDYSEYNRITQLISKFNLPKLKNINIKKIEQFINKDKKNINNELNYIILNKIGEAKIENNYCKQKIIKALKIL